jgi:hypothetical protein
MTSSTLANVRALMDHLDAAAKTLRIERAIEETNEHGLKIKGSKTERGKRTAESC